MEDVTYNEQDSQDSFVCYDIDGVRLTKENSATNDFLSKEYNWLWNQLRINVGGLLTCAGDNKSTVIETVLKARDALLQIASKGFYSVVLWRHVRMA